MVLFCVFKGQSEGLPGKTEEKNPTFGAFGANIINSTSAIIPHFRLFGLKFVVLNYVPHFRLLKPLFGLKFVLAWALFRVNVFNFCIFIKTVIQILRGTPK